MVENNRRHSQHGFIKNKLSDMYFLLERMAGILCGSGAIDRLSVDFKNFFIENSTHIKQWQHSRNSCKVDNIVSITQIKNRNFQPLNKTSMCLILIPTSSLHKEIILSCVVITSLYILICLWVLVSQGSHNLLWYHKEIEIDLSQFQSPET